MPHVDEGMLDRLVALSERLAREEERIRELERTNRDLLRENERLANDLTMLRRMERAFAEGALA